MVIWPPTVEAIVVPTIPPIWLTSVPWASSVLMRMSACFGVLDETEEIDFENVFGIVTMMAAGAGGFAREEARRGFAVVVVDRQPRDDVRHVDAKC